MRILLFSFCMIFVANVSYAQTGTFSETRNLNCGDTAYIGVGYPVWNPATIVQHAQKGYTALIGDFPLTDILYFKAPYCAIGADTVVVACAKATQITCDTGIYIFNYTCADTADEVRVFDVLCNDTISTNDLTGWSAPIMTMSPMHGKGKVVLGATDGATVEYIPNPGFEGLDFAKVDIWGGQKSIVYLFQIRCILPTTAVFTPHFESLTMTPNPTHDGLLRVVYDKPIDQWMVFDALGRQIETTMHNTTDGLILQLPHLDNGVYMVWVRSGHSWSVGKVVSIR